MSATDRSIAVLDSGFVRYIDHMGTDRRIVEAARISYQSPSKGDVADKKLLRYLYTNKHSSPFEMCKITFNVKMPIFVMRQWVRHRMQNLNEVSARYSQLPNDFYRPTNWRLQDSKNKQSSIDFDPDSDDAKECKLRADAMIEKAYSSAYLNYKKLIDLGIAREMARIVLPVGIYTECYSTWDLNNLLKFFTLRDDSHAQAEIQEYAKAMKEITFELFPWTMEIYEETRKGK